MKMRFGQCENILLPGKPGTKKLKRVYGKNLVAVRYRYDKTRNLSFKTVGILIEQHKIRKKKKK